MSTEAHALAHHFDDLDQQHKAGELGMWIFLVTEVMIFGGLFTAYGVYRSQRLGEARDEVQAMLRKLARR